MAHFTRFPLTIFIGLLPMMSIAGPELADLHLQTLPRTAREAARIATVTAPTTQFDKAEQFESNPAGAATVRPTDTSDAFSLPSGNIGFAKELAAQPSAEKQQRLFDKLVAKAYQQGKALNMASFLEIDAVIDPQESRQWILRGLNAFGFNTGRHGGRPFVDTF